MANYQLNAELRTEVGSAEVKKMRRNKRVPGNVYGLNKGSTLVSVSVRDLEKTLASGVNLIDLTVDGTKKAVLVKEVQTEPTKGFIQHVDFLEVSMDQPVDTTVPIMIADDRTRTADNGLVSLVMRELNISCLPGDIPDSIAVDVSELSIGSVVLVSDLQVAGSVTVKDAADDVVVTVSAPAVAEEAEETEAAEEATEEPEATE